MNVKESEIAIIGMDGRFPKANDLESFWSNLKNGVDCITTVPPGHWEPRYYKDEEYRKSISSHFGGFLDDISKFDAGFFNMSPAEVEIIDPQERIFLEVAWKSLEDAAQLGGLLHDKYKGNVGVFVGAINNDYKSLGVEQSIWGQPVSFAPMLGGIANRTSYFLDFNGPSITVDTQCSSALTAIYLACQSIRTGDCSVALAGGVNLLLHSNRHILLTNRGFLSKSGRCKSFSKGADGYVPSEGVGCIVLKKAKDALIDGDNIYGVISGIGMSHGGRPFNNKNEGSLKGVYKVLKVATHKKIGGYLVPNVFQQKETIVKAMKDANVSAQQISVIESHGTGTVLGDPIEIEALSMAFSDYTNNKQFCSIGSVKSNIGHCESAAGISGVIKVLLQMKYKMIVPSLHSEELNPIIDFKETPFKVQKSLEEWKCMKQNGKKIPNIAGVSSFGAGGLNVHLIIKEHRQKKNKGIKQSVNIYPLSGRDAEMLINNVKKICYYLQEKNCEEYIDNIAYTLQVGKYSFKKRVVFIAEGKDELIELMSEYVESKNELSSPCRDIYEGVKTKKSGNENRLEMARRWISGEKVDWSQHYKNMKPYKLSLPTYSFAKEYYWPYVIKTECETIEDLQEKESVIVLVNNQEVDDLRLNNKYKIYLSEKIDTSEIMCKIIDSQETITGIIDADSKLIVVSINMLKNKKRSLNEFVSDFVQLLVNKKHIGKQCRLCQSQLLDEMSFSNSDGNIYIRKQIENDDSIQCIVEYMDNDKKQTVKIGTIKYELK